MKIKIYAIGHLKEAYLKRGINEYLERLKPYTQIEIVEVDDESVNANPSPKEIEMVKDKEVLEIATGPGLLAKHIAPAAKSILATDYSDGMIAEARKGDCPENLRFEVADAMSLPYTDNSFDAVLIANALHIVNKTEKVLSEIDRVLRPGGLLIAPNFVEHKGTFISRLWSGILRVTGVRFEHQWSAQEYLGFLKNNGWHVTFSKEMAARIAMMYTECIREKRGDYYKYDSKRTD